jgi:predicted enzyme related to lactoylglutathione lyase
MSIARLYSADVYVHDLGKAVDFYVGTLGFEQRAGEPVDEEGHRWVGVAPKGAETAIILSRGFGAWSLEKVGGWSRLIVDSDDMAGTVTALKAKGVAFESEPEEFPFGTYAQIQGPDGNIFGLLQAASE